MALHSWKLKALDTIQYTNRNRILSINVHNLLKCHIQYENIKPLPNNIILIIDNYHNILLLEDHR